MLYPLSYGGESRRGQFVSFVRDVCEGYCHSLVHTLNDALPTLRWDDATPLRIASSQRRGSAVDARAAIRRNSSTKKHAGPARTAEAAHRTTVSAVTTDGGPVRVSVHQCRTTGPTVSSGRSGSAQPAVSSAGDRGTRPRRIRGATPTTITRGYRRPTGTAVSAPCRTRCASTDCVSAKTTVAARRATQATGRSAGPSRDAACGHIACRRAAVATIATSTVDRDATSTTGTAGTRGARVHRTTVATVTTSTIDRVTARTTSATGTRRGRDRRTTVATIATVAVGRITTRTTSATGTRRGRAHRSTVATIATIATRAGHPRESGRAHSRARNSSEPERRSGIAS